MLAGRIIGIFRKLFLNVTLDLADTEEKSSGPAQRCSPIVTLFGGWIRLRLFTRRRYSCREVK